MDDTSENGQKAVAAFLHEAAADGGGTVRRVDTHGAMVFLGGRDVYKVKRAVRFPYMDFSTLDRREAACRNEIAVNRANAPEIYKGVVAITREADGSLAIDGTGETVEWAVHMARFDETRELDRLAAAGTLDAAILTPLARQIAAAHARAPARGGDPVAAFARIIADNDTDFLAMDDMFAPDAAARLGTLSRERLNACAGLMRARAAQGHVRHCHGDLHLKNIVLIDDQPVLFDAIEFDDAMATIDVLYDLAFLLMDLLTRDMGQAANLVLNEYLKAAGGGDAHVAGLAAMPLFLSVRAAIRAKVTATALKHKGPEERRRDTAAVRRYFDAALAYLAPPPARLVAIGGLSGTGKTTVARAIADHVGPAPGAVHLRSDVERKRLFGVGETERLPEAAYAPDASRQVYERLIARARAVLRAGHGVVLDAVQAKPEERATVAALASEMGISFTGIWLEAQGALLRDRVEARRGDASDATAAVVEKQLGYDIGAMEWARVDASRPVSRVAGDVLRHMDVPADTD